MKPEEVHQFIDLFNRYPRLLTLQGKIQTIIFPVLSSESLGGWTEFRLYTTKNFPG